MEQTSRKEKFQRKRSHSKNKKRRRLATTVLIVSFFTLAILFWITYNSAQKQEATPPGQTANPGTSSSGGDVPAGGTGKPDPGGANVPSTGTPKPGDTGSAGGTPTDSGKTPGTGTTEPSGSAGAGAGAGQDDPNRVQLTFVGDVIFADNVEATLKRNGYDYPYKNVQSYLEKADLTIANLETPITERGTAQIKQYAYRSTPAALPAFKQAGIDLVNLANNHILDYGTTGLLDTFSHLDKNGIRWFGAGRNVTEAFKPVIIEIKGMKIAFIGLSKVVPSTDWKAGKNTPGVADTYALTLPLQTIEKAKKEADLVVVVAHWGLERHDMPEAYQKDYARQYIDAGADLIIGGHPHVLQGFENYKGKWIAYSLGNFIFTMNEDPVTWETVILQASCSKDGGCELQAVPVLTKLANPEPMAEEAAVKLFKRLTDISFGAQINKEGIISTK
ncbi:CapA family protein [Paenibacillus sp. GYB004]|uniref:CapA family protein n=1 Tax=Paenibacillus sp. GYB004 TaxID=2994393 RepID=UPI002F962D9C